MSSTAPTQAHYASNSPSFIEKLSDWESATNPLAPLSTEQKDVYLELAASAGSMPLPKGLPLDDPVNVQHSSVTKQVHPAGSIEDTLQKGFLDMGFGSDKVHDVQQFYEWFNKIERNMSEMEDDGYTEYLQTLKQYHDHCKNIISVIDEALTSINELDKKYVFVSTKTNALHDACEQLLADQTKLMNAADAIQTDLVYFNEHGRISTKLNGTNLAVTGEAFQTLLMRIDECINFMVKHSTYRDSAEYLSKFKACRASALMMIKKYIVKSFYDTTSNILSRQIASPESNAGFVLGGENLSSNTQEDAFTLFYGKFRTNAPRIIGLVEQIEKRLELDPDYGHLLNEIHNCYFSKREQLVGPSVTAAMTELLAANKQDQCSLVRSGCSFMVHVCEDEHQLYSHFFTKLSPKLDEMLQRLCGSLYDMLRPLIIHVYHLETLSELCTILKTEMLDDHVQNYPVQLKAFEHVAKQMLEDVQERLVFRVNIHIKNDILGYKPAPGDLAYPEKLEMMEEIARSIKETAEKEVSEKSFTDVQLDDSAEHGEQSKKSRHDQSFKTSPADMHGMWFPTVRRVLVCLSKLYRCIDKTIFQGLSQEALQACVQSLVNASNAIRSRSHVKDIKSSGKVAKPKIVDSLLFLIKHLLILREQIAPFQGEFAIRETQLDFTRTRDAAYHMLDFQTLPKLLRVDSNNAILQFFVAGSPEVKEFYIDSKKDVDRQLKLACEDFIEHVSKSLTTGLTDFLSKSKVVTNLNNEDGGTKTSLRQQPFATPEVLKDIVAGAYRDVKLVGKSIQSSLSLYLANRETENILFKPVKLNVQQIYQQLQIILLENYTEEDRAIIAAPTPNQVSALLSAVRK